MAVRSPTASLDENRYASKRMSYPSDITNLAHSIVFYINVHEKSKDILPKKTGFDEADRPIILEGSRSQMDLNRDSKSNDLRETRPLSLSRNTRRITDNIQLYMPEIMQFDYNQTYEQPSLTSATGSVLGGLAVIAGKAISAGKSGAITNTLKNKFLRAGASGAASGATTLLKAATGVALNPIIEVLYTQPALRKFQFDFTFAPSSEEETESVKKIIKEFRRHQAPEYAFGGLFFLSPSEFDIVFLMNTGNGFTVNENIPKISSCVLESLNINYSPQGPFTTFYDGMPVSIQLRLAFMEVDIVTRESIDKFDF